jgi:hypothetical protein
MPVIKGKIHTEWARLANKGDYELDEDDAEKLLKNKSITVHFRNDYHIPPICKVVIWCSGGWVYFDGPVNDNVNSESMIFLGDIETIEV